MSYSQKERDFIGRLEEEFGLAAMRAPASGGATARDLPDVIALRPHPLWDDTGAEAWSFEFKYRSAASTYFDREDIEQLIRWRDVSGAKVRFAFRFNANKKPMYGDTETYLVLPEDIPTTETKGKVVYDDVVEVGKPLPEVFGDG